ncbi:DUF3551 domain-containing protein [Bradyrhizobium sp. CCBAU 11357]|uniref:DUF3551 domain-containing protein n=1 Tax=Bradyrhizobium sp. CCBAU 11357 TaxID=1630808 RepID=UPI00230417FE|nr:DUF3551 domain-containing protein [Bradyrhizobium sp. CCBAU 11357]
MTAPSMIATVIALVAPAAAEPLDPRYPVCLQKWEWGGSSRTYCSFLSWEDCRAAAMGLSAMCLANPYWSQPGQSGPSGAPHGRSAPMTRTW